MTLEELFTKEYEILKEEKAKLKEGLEERDQEIGLLRNQLDAETKYKEALERLILALEPQQREGFIRVNKTYISEHDKCHDLYELLQKFVKPDPEPNEEE